MKNVNKRVREELFEHVYGERPLRIMMSAVNWENFALVFRIIANPIINITQYKMERYLYDLDHGSHSPSILRKLLSRYR